MAIEWHRLADPKVKPSLGKRFVKGILARCRRRKGLIARLRARKKRTDDTYAAGIREQVAARDGYCRYGYDVALGNRFVRCSGLSEWAHFGDKKRARTRGMKPEERHTTAGSLCLCQFHHQAYDSGRLIIIAKSDRGCDGPLRYRETR